MTAGASTSSRTLPSSECGGPVPAVLGGRWPLGAEVTSPAVLQLPDRRGPHCHLGVPAHAAGRAPGPCAHYGHHRVSLRPGEHHLQVPGGGQRSPRGPPRGWDPAQLPVPCSVLQGPNTAFLPVPGQEFQVGRDSQLCPGPSRRLVGAVSSASLTSRSLAHPSSVVARVPSVCVSASRHLPLEGPVLGGPAVAMVPAPLVGPSSTVLSLRGPLAYPFPRSVSLHRKQPASGEKCPRGSLCVLHVVLGLSFPPPLFLSEPLAGFATVGCPLV